MSRAKKISEIFNYEQRRREAQEQEDARKSLDFIRSFDNVINKKLGKSVHSRNAKVDHKNGYTYYVITYNGYLTLYFNMHDLSGVGIMPSSIPTGSESEEAYRMKRFFVYTIVQEARSRNMYVLPEREVNQVMRVDYTRQGNHSFGSKYSRHGSGRRF